MSMTWTDIDRDAAYQFDVDRHALAKCDETCAVCAEELRDEDEIYERENVA